MQEIAGEFNFLVIGYFQIEILRYKSLIYNW